MRDVEARDDAVKEWEAYEAPATIMRMLGSTGAFLWSLTPEQRRLAEFPLDDPRRLDWDFIPKPDRIGVPLWSLDKHQRTLAQSLLQAGLSLRGYTQALQVMSLENILRELEVSRMGVGTGDFRHQDGYYFSFFGRPAMEETWGWRVLGHHLSLSYTIINQRYLTVTPCNLGAQPAEVGVLSPLRQDEQLGFGLLESLTPRQRRVAVIHDVAPADYATRQVPHVGQVEYPDYYDLGILSYQLTDEDREALKFVRDEPAGICGSSLTPDQAQRLLDLVDWYLGRVPDELAAKQRDRLERHGLATLFFSWAGGQQTGTPHYYRVHGRDMLIEFDNAIGNGTHIHSVWRDLNNDLGHDLLLDHYERERLTGHHLLSRLTSSVPYDAPPRPPATHGPLGPQAFGGGPG